VVATPGALYRYWRQNQTGGRLALVLIAGTLPGVIAGSVIRVELLPGPRVFELVVAAVLLPLGAWLTLTRPVHRDRSDDLSQPMPPAVLVVLAAAVGCIGGIYGIGGGSILSPILIGSGRQPAEVAPAALASTFVTSVAGVITFTILSLHEHGAVAPDWPTGIAGHRRPCWRLHRCPHSVPPARCPDPPPGWRAGGGDRRAVPVVRPGLIHLC
jgi:uncharacterized protein